MYDIISIGHIATDHGGRDRMLKLPCQKYATSQHKLLNSTSLTALYARRNKNIQEPLLWTSRSCRHAVKPTRSVQVDNGLSMPSNKVCNPQGFVIKESSEIAYQLLDIFLLVGLPTILQSDNGSEFTAHIITELKDMW